MQILPDGTPAPYQTKAERIAQLEEALEAIRQAPSLDAVRLIVSTIPSTGRKWKKPSPLSHAELMKAAESLDGAKDAPEATTGDA